jgi:glycosyltransferase involved in cell wall biosynthesis
MPAGPEISVIIPTYQRRTSVVRALESLMAQTLPRELYEVVTVIDGSSDGTADALRRLATPYRMVAVEQANRGQAAARNAGVARAAGDLLVFLDDDMEAGSGFLEAHRHAHRDGARRVVLGPAPVVVEAGDPPLVEYRARRFEARLAALAAPGYRLTYSDMYTGNLSVRRALLLEAGLFDEAFRLYGHEDYELALRLGKAGAEFVFSPGALAHQHYEKTFPALARDSVARGRTAVHFSRKHPEVTSRLKLGQGARATPKWRALRGLLLGLTRVLPPTVNLVTRVVESVERRRPRGLDRYYDMALDYYYWVGVRAAGGSTNPGHPEPTIRSAVSSSSPDR